jgi:ATP-dependent Clp protease protease subunit
LTKLYVKHNTASKSYQDFERDMDRDTFMSAEEALAYGLVDKIISERP